MTDISLSKTQHVNYVRLFVFLVIAYGVSNIFRFNIYDINAGLEKSFTWSYLIIEGVLEGTGIFIAGMEVFHFISKEAKIFI